MRRGMVLSPIRDDTSCPVGSAPINTPKRLPGLQQRVPVCNGLS